MFIPITVSKVRPGAGTRRRKSAGFSLIEVLVTILILAFGLLGVAGLLVKGVSNSASSDYTTKANQLISDMADRMRANSGEALNASSQYLTDYTGTNSVIPTSPTTIAAVDRKEWMTALKTQLPAGAGRISNTVSAGARTVNIEVRWSKCLGTLTDTEKTACTDNSATAFRYLNLEIRL